MQQDGKCGGMDTTQGKALRDGFLNNFRKMQKESDRYKELQLKLMEPGVNKAKVTAEKEEINLSVNVLKGILARQLTTGIWKEPTTKYVNKLQERKALEKEINIATGQVFPKRDDEDIYEMSFKGLYRDVVAFET